MASNPQHYLGLELNSNLKVKDITLTSDQEYLAGGNTCPLKGHVFIGHRALMNPTLAGILEHFLSGPFRISDG